MTKLEKPIFVFVIKTIFYGKKSTSDTLTWLFTNSLQTKPKVVYVEAKASQDLLIASTIRSIISLPSFKQLYNDDITFVP